MEWLQENWVQVGVIALAAHTLLKGIRDAIDKTPQTDDNFFEKAVTLIGKVAGYLFGSRSK